MWVVIDTNIFFHDLRIRKSLDLLFKDIENVHFSLRIPEVVVRETINKYKEQRQALISKLVSSSEGLKSLTSFEYNVKIDESDLARDLWEYEHYLRGKIMSNGEIVPFPDISIQNLVDRDLDRRKPFKENGAGFRDTLIWETILNLASHERCEGIVFITENTRDFTENNNLHSDLTQDLERRGVDPNALKPFYSVEQFIEILVIPALNDIREIKDAILAGTHTNIDLNTITEQYLWDLIEGFAIDPDCLPAYREDNEDLTLSWGVSDYEIVTDDLTVKRLSESELLITAGYTLDCEIQLFVPRWEAYNKSFKELGFSISDPDWNEAYILANIVLPFKITLRYVYNQEITKVTSADIVSAECLQDYRE